MGNYLGYSEKFMPAYRRQAAEEGLKAGAGAQGGSFCFATPQNPHFVNLILSFQQPKNYNHTPAPRYIYRLFFS